MKSARTRVFLALLVAIAAAGTLAAEGRAAAPRVLAVEFVNDVNPVTADYLVGQLRRAERERYSAVVVLLDTPGGLAESMREITKAELALRIPLIVYVAPDGARAASAGVWIGQAADLLAMAPQTNLGSSTPIASGGGEIPSDLKRKVVNDAAASLRALAEEHGRNGDWAERAVRQAANINAREALRLNVIDLVAPDLPTLLERADGRRTEPRGKVLRTAGARVERVEMSLWKRILDTIIDPNIVVLLMSLGALGILVEIYNPGLVFPGALGGISLITGLFGLQVLPVSWAGILLMLLALGFFVAEAVVVSHGALATAGGASFVVGSLMLFDPAGDAYQVSLPVALAVGGTLALVTALALARAAQARRLPAATGAEAMVGALATVRPGGYVFAQGELWRARWGDDEPLQPGERVVVEAVEGLELRVRRERASEPVA